MKIHVPISCVVLLALALSCEGFFLKGQKSSVTASVDATKKTNQPGVDIKALLGKLVGVKIFVINIVRSGINKHFDKKINRLNKFGGSESASGGGGAGLGGSLGAIGSLGGLGGLLGGLGSLTGGSTASKPTSASDFDDFDSFDDDGDDGVSSYSSGSKK